MKISNQIHLNNPRELNKQINFYGKPHFYFLFSFSPCSVSVTNIYLRSYFPLTREKSIIPSLHSSDECPFYIYSTTIEFIFICVEGKARVSDLRNSKCIYFLTGISHLHTRLKSITDIPHRPCCLFEVICFALERSGAILCGLLHLPNTCIV